MRDAGRSDQCSIIRRETILSHSAILISSMSTERARWCHNGEVQGSHQRTSVRLGTSLSFLPYRMLPTPGKKMHGRFFSGRKVEASLWIGKQRFQRTGVAEDVEEIGGEEGEKKRLDDFAHWLLTEGD